MPNKSPAPGRFDELAKIKELRRQDWSKHGQTGLVDPWQAINAKLSLKVRKFPQRRSETR